MPYNYYWLYVYTHLCTSLALVQGTGLPGCLFLTLLMRCPWPQPQHNPRTQPAQRCVLSPTRHHPAQKTQQWLCGHIHQKFEHKLSVDLVQTPHWHSFDGIIPKGARKDVLTPIASARSGASTRKEA